MSSKLRTSRALLAVSEMCESRARLEGKLLPSSRVCLSTASRSAFLAKPFSISRCCPGISLVSINTPQHDCTHSDTHRTYSSSTGCSSPMSSTEMCTFLCTRTLFFPCSTSSNAPPICETEANVTCVCCSLTRRKYSTGGAATAARIDIWGREISTPKALPSTWAGANSTSSPPSPEPACSAWASAHSSSSLSKSTSCSSDTAISEKPHIQTQPFLKVASSFSV
mmetsp:Transcript_40160/g.78926  ORF Transcript_40160/g.78926 Transcript_40160/m.78926 type:complete len:224 (-) Transcript_40160:1906-2577(-)